MATYTSDIVYSVKGMDQSTGQVIKLTDAITKLEKRGVPLSQSAQKAAAGIRAMDVATQSALQRLSGSNQSIDPLRMGLASLATQYIQTGRAATSSEAAIAQLSTTQKSAIAINNALLLGMGAGALVAAGYAGSVIKTADAYTALRGKIAVYATDAANAAEVEERLYRVAEQARTSIDGVIALYSRLAPAFTDLGRTQEEAARFTELVSKALTAQGATTQETEAATLQLAQALASGVLRGDEFKSMMEASPGLMRQMAAGFETVGGKIGVPTGALRAMAEEGELTADRVIAAIMRQSDVIETQFSKAPKTVAQAMTVLNNEMSRAIGRQMMDSGAQAGLADSLMKVAAAADDVVKALTQATQAALLLGAGLGGAKLISMVAQFAQLQRATLAAAVAVEAFGVAQRSALSVNAITTTQTLASNLPKVTQAATVATTAFSGLNAASLASATAAVRYGAAVDAAAVRAANATRQNIVLDGSFGMQARTVENATRVFGTFNAAAGATASNLPAVANATGALTARVTTLTVAKNAATVALTGFRTAGAALITMLGGPWSIAIMAAVGAVYALERATNEATQAQIGQQEMLASFSPIVSQYEAAMARAATASGKLKTEALATADALKQQAIAMYRTAEAEVIKRKSALSEAQILQQPFPQDPMAGGYRALAGVVMEPFAKGDLANAQGKLKAAEEQLKAFGLVVDKMPRGQTSITPGSPEAAKSPFTPPGKVDEAAAKKAQAAAERMQKIRERDIGLLAQYTAAAEQAANAAQAREEADLKTTLDRLNIEEREKKRKAIAEINDATIEANALSQISAEFEAKRSAARKAYADKLVEIDRDALERRRRIIEQEAQLFEQRSQAEVDRAKDGAKNAASQGSLDGAERYFARWTEAMGRVQAARAANLENEIQGLNDAAAKEIENLRIKLGNSQEFATRRLQIEADLQRKIAILRGQEADQIKRENDARINEQVAIQEDAARQAIAKVREKNSAWYEAGQSSADAFKNAIMTNKWDDLGRNIVMDLLNAAYDELLGNPLKDLIRGALDTIFSPSGGNTSGTKPGQTPPILPMLASIFGFADGGIMTSSGSMPLRKYAAGGIADRPQLAMFGEGSMPEAYVPLPDGRSIPVTMQGPYADIAPGSRGGARPVQVVVSPTYNIDATGADPAGLARVEQRLNEMERDLPVNVVNLVSEAVYNRQVA
jgi:tape measure domain-containing protein